MAEVTDLHILAKMANGSPDEEDAFVVRDPKSEEVKFVIHNLHELVDVLSKIEANELFPSLCRMDKNDIECDVALWVHYVLGDAVLSAKIFNKVKEHHSNPTKLKLEVFNLCFNRFLNFQEITEYSDDLTPFDEEAQPSDL